MLLPKGVTENDREAGSGLAKGSARSSLRLPRDHAHATSRGNSAAIGQFSAMIRITITPAAFEAIAATLPSSVGVEDNRAPNGDRYIWLDPKYVDGLRAIRKPGESYSDVILRVARG